ncbi:ATP-binding cassette domain-containing protein [Lapillicoccus jejuensis]|uniref:D-xylose transport system ATP-binding protein n=1 Tax=Lapillicoccus jejuensis TaxID=402171 RepID=A0A542E104_9MICO|nr:ATP-binding cassette domain-containing protein [Lapillicoccus jejuensis]TQJ09016.1 D-xylose transport system ATP-binding protein [Lapillicoccus jejuensis]
MSTATTSTTTPPAIETRGLVKRFGGVHALQDVSVTFPRGEITALIGDNGAGKSTLIKTLAGLHVADEGVIEVDGTVVQVTSPRVARELGIETVYQDLGLVDDLTVAENLFLSREPIRSPLLGRLLDKGRMRVRAREMLDEMGAGHRIPVDGIVRWMSGGQRQAVAICRAVAWGASVVILDEPTAALGVNESAEVHQLVRRLREQGITVILISHNFEEIMSLADQVWVMRRGKAVAHRRIADTTGPELVGLLTGATVDDRGSVAAPPVSA